MEFTNSAWHIPLNPTAFADAVTVAMDNRQNRQGYAAIPGRKLASGPAAKLLAVAQSFLPPNSAK